MATFTFVDLAVEGVKLEKVWLKYIFKEDVENAFALLGNPSIEVFEVREVFLHQFPTVRDCDSMCRKYYSTQLRKNPNST